MTRRIVLILMILTLILGFVLFVPRELFDPHNIGTLLEKFRTWKAANAIGFAIGFFVTYVLIAAFSLPIAGLMTICAGALFGFWQGLLIDSFASSIGATLAFLTARYLLRDGLEKRFPDFFTRINEGLARDGAFYLLTLRLIPIFPFFIVNLLMGITKMRTGVYYIVSQIGMLPVTAAFTFAGVEISKVEHVGHILTPRMFLILLILGLTPWIGKVIVSLLRRRRLFSKWTKPKSFDRNLIVIGAGAAGLVSAYIATTVKAKVTLIESHKMGGDCLNYGCVPSKALIASANLAHDIKSAEEYGINTSGPIIDFPKVMQRVQSVIKKIEPHDSIERYQALGVDVIQGRAEIIDPWHVKIHKPNGETQTLSTRATIIATGAAPIIPKIEGLDLAKALTSETLWQYLATLEKAPEKFAILGGGPIGCELAQALSRLGSKVVLIEASAALLPKEDGEISALLKTRLESEGVKVLTAHKAIRFSENIVECESEAGIVEVEYDALLLALGRQPRLTGLGLDRLDIATDRPLEVNAFLETSYPNILVAGDVAGAYQFTHTASYQAWIASVNSLFGRFKKFKIDHRVIPWAIFTDPEIARVGLSEKQALADGIDVDVTSYQLEELDRAIAEGRTQGFVKVLTAKGSGRILGAVIAGHHSGELIHEFVLAMRHKLSLNKVLGTIHIYPTMMEANKYVAGEWKRRTSNPKIINLLEKFHRWQRK